MFQTLDHFFKSWEFEADATQKLLNCFTDESLKQEITSQNWTLGRIAWHTVAAIRIITSNTDLTFHAPAEDYPVPASAQFIADSYHQASNAFIQALKTQWTDHTLQERINFIGQQLPNGSLLMFMIQHQNHHRGQMTVLMRQAGLTVPGIYGPAKEEWTKFGLEPPQM
ncbi:DinB family protein [Bacillus spizizenii]|uniref:DinB family protein n=1 Tax=Bacillus spizizenii TaxID=96241 RepID=UPI00227F2307|nr:DinB family protein [Bacillus spizizenii]MDU7574660.1 DinB family protein [Bacillus subtilis]MCY7797391.1 DinB family protein [Bacillus spizizenii]MCY7805861.1 DinB family protein [Bacillus spizizenii]MCY7808681.1 DinB family protein [Bacillus spizizenii]MCY7813097.1 DinB family protein [Bacillus spizizenii]